MNVKLILEYIKLLGMAVVYTAGQAICFWILLPLLAEMFGQIDFYETEL